MSCIFAEGFLVAVVGGSALVSWSLTSLYYRWRYRRAIAQQEWLDRGLRENI